MIRVQLQPAYILHVRAYRETSQLLEVLSRDHGRVGMVARGVRGARSRWRYTLQPFRPLLLSWSHRGELGTLTGADQVAAPPGLSGEALYCGLYMNELLMRFLQRSDPHPEVFERYRDSLATLASASALQPCLRLFEKHLLEATGFGLVLDHDYPGNEPLQADAWYEYRPERGPVRVSGRVSEGSPVVSGRALQSLRAGQLAEEDLPSLRGMLRRVIRHHLGARPLASERLYAGPARRKRMEGETR